MLSVAQAAPSGGSIGFEEDHRLADKEIHVRRVPLCHVLTPKDDPHLHESLSAKHANGAIPRWYESMAKQAIGRAAAGVLAAGSIR